MDNAAIIGYGTVGHATAQAFGIKKYYSRSESNIDLEGVSRCRYIFVCLPTPTIENKQETLDLIDIIQKIHDYGMDNIVILRSTVLPGFNRLLQASGIKNVVSNPEFLSEATALSDAKHPDLVVVGGDYPKLRSYVVALYKSRFKDFSLIETDSVTAELIKYALNTFFATKVIFANEIFDVAQKTGANYETIREVLENHKWGSKNHFRVWYNDKRGVHGKCLPKDTRALAAFAKSPFFQMIMERNQRFE